MKWYLKILFVPVLVVNLLTALLLLVCAYSPMLPAEYMPLLSLAGLAFPFVLAANVAFFLLWLLFYRPFMLVSLVAFVVCVPQIRAFFPLNMAYQNPPAESFKLVSYNILSSNLKSSTANRDNPLVTYLEGCEADIICLQECAWGDKLKKKDVDYALRNYRYKHHHPLSKGRNGLACYSRYPILSATSIKYKSIGNGSIAYRIKVEEDTLLVINNHLESFRIKESDVEIYHSMMENLNRQELASGSKTLLKKLSLPAATRARQADSIAKHISRSPHQKVIVCGDFNDSPISYTHRVVGRNLKDAFVESGNGWGISYHENRFYFRIDHILLSKNMKSYDCTVDHSVKSSDHYPIWCSISWE